MNTLSSQKCIPCRGNVPPLTESEIAEQEDHHPRIVTEWGRVAVQWWTHVISGLHRNDFIMAAKTDELFG